MTEPELQPDDIDVAAGLWLQRLREPEAGPDVLSAFQEWQRADPCHAEAFERAMHAWDMVGEHAFAPEILRFRQDALSHVEAEARERARERRLWPYLAAASLALLTLATAALYILYPEAKPLRYATQIGERRTLLLTDNSQVDIDADSAISVEFTGKERRIRLLRGQAYFQVAKDASRPFEVESVGRTVIATGTQFDVEMSGQSMRVTLVEGHVNVRSADAGGAPGTLLAKLMPGDELTISPNSAPELVHGADVLAVTAWRQGKLVFDDTPIAEAMDEMARYSHQSVTVAPSAASIKVSGVFTVGDMAGFISALESYYPVKLSADPGGGLVLRHR